MIKEISDIYGQMVALFKHNLAIVFTVVFAFLAPIQPLIIIVGFMILIDTGTGIMRSKMLGQRITSRKLSQIVTKMLLYQGAVISLFIVEKFLLGEFICMFTTVPFFLTKVGAMTLVFIESTSINENIAQATGINIWDGFKKMLSRAKHIKDGIEALAKNKIDEKK